MDALASVAKFIGATARVCATVALGALVIYALRRAGVVPFAALDGPTYQIIMSAGVIGFCGVVVDLLIAFGNGVRGAWAKLQQQYGACVDSGARCNGSMRTGFARLCQAL